MISAWCTRRLFLGSWICARPIGRFVVGFFGLRRHAASVFALFALGPYWLVFGSGPLSADEIHPPTVSSSGMVVSSSADAARAGASILEKGGNAVDAAVATAFAVAVTQPFSAGLGGGAFVLLRTGDGQVFAVDARETAPAAATSQAAATDGPLQCWCW